MARPLTQGPAWSARQTNSSLKLNVPRPRRCGFLRATLGLAPGSVRPRAGFRDCNHQGTFGHGRYCEFRPERADERENRAGIHRRAARLGRRHPSKISVDDRHAVADLVARLRRKILRGLRRLHDRRRVDPDRSRFPHFPGRKGHRQRREPRRHFVRRRAARRIVRLFRPQADVHRRDDHLLRVPGAVDPVPEFSVARHLPVRPRSGARLRLPDRAHDHFGEHPERQSRQIGARRLCLSGGGRARRHRDRLSRPQMVADARRLALDVRHCLVPGHRRHGRPVSSLSKAPIGWWCAVPTMRPRNPSIGFFFAARSIRAE